MPSRRVSKNISHRQRRTLIHKTVRTLSVQALPQPRYMGVDFASPLMHRSGKTLAMIHLMREYAEQDKVIYLTSFECPDANKTLESLCAKLGVSNVVIKPIRVGSEYKLPSGS